MLSSGIKCMHINLGLYRHNAVPASCCGATDAPQLAARALCRLLTKSKVQGTMYTPTTSSGMDLLCHRLPNWISRDSRESRKE